MSAAPLLMPPDELKAWLYRRTVAEAQGFGMRIVEEHSAADKPWGAYLRVAENTIPAFYAAYWQGIEVPAPSAALRLDPKLLLVAPGARLSLQYHHRRSEHWRVLDGPIRVVRGADEASLTERDYQPGEVIRLACGEWHRLVGLEQFGRIAEIWQHEDAANPSGEEDIVRVQDDYGR